MQGSGIQLQFAHINHTTYGDSIIAIIEGITTGPLSSTTAYMSFDSELHRTRFYRDAWFTGGVRDKDGDLGTSGQIASSTGTQFDWIDPPAGGSLPVDTVSIQMVVEHWDVDVIDGTEVRFNIPSQYDKYEIIRVEAYVTTAGVTNATTFEIENISAATVIDNTLSIASGTLTDSTVGLTHEVDAGEEISIEVTGNSTTEALGCRVIVVLAAQ